MFSCLQVAGNERILDFACTDTDFAILKSTIDAESVSYSLLVQPCDGNSTTLDVCLSESAQYSLLFDLERNVWFYPGEGYIYIYQRLLLYQGVSTYKKIRVSLTQGKGRACLGQAEAKEPCFFRMNEQGDLFVVYEDLLGYVPNKIIERELKKGSENIDFLPQDIQFRGIDKSRGDQNPISLTCYEGGVDILLSSQVRRYSLDNSLKTISALQAGFPLFSTKRASYRANCIYSTTNTKYIGTSKGLVVLFKSIKDGVMKPPVYNTLLPTQNILEVKPLREIVGSAVCETIYVLTCNLPDKKIHIYRVIEGIKKSFSLFGTSNEIKRFEAEKIAFINLPSLKSLPTKAKFDFWSQVTEGGRIASKHLFISIDDYQLYHVPVNSRDGAYLRVSDKIQFMPKEQPSVSPPTSLETSTKFPGTTTASPREMMTELQEKLSQFSSGAVPGAGTFAASSARSVENHQTPAASSAMSPFKVSPQGYISSSRPSVGMPSELGHPRDSFFGKIASPPSIETSQSKLHQGCGIPDSRAHSHTPPSIGTFLQSLEQQKKQNP